MNRRNFLYGLAGVAAIPLSIPVLGRLTGGDTDAGAYGCSDSDIATLEKSDDEWRRLLPEDAYEVLFEEDTERAFTSPLNEETRDGKFVCAACFLPLFDSKTKFKSGTGWPSFYQPIAGRICTKADYKLIIRRTEYHCARCGGHQGHIFDDGPPPTGKRFCNNGLALNFVPAGRELPALRS